LLTVIANILLITVILRTKGLRRQKFNLFMVSLCVTDLLVGLIVGPFNPLRKQGTWNFGWIWCKVYLSLVPYLITASIYNFVGVNMDRLFAIKFPLKYRDMQDKRWTVKLVIAFCWTIALVSALPIWFDQTESPLDSGAGCTCNFPYNNKVWVWLSSIFSFILPTILILIVWAIIIQFFLTDTSGVTESANTRRGREKRVTLVMGVITVTFLVCIWPFATVFMIQPNPLFSLLGVSHETFHMLTAGIVVLTYSNSLINPILYIAINRQVRHAIVSFLSRREIDNRQFSTAEDSDEKEGWQRSLSRQLSRQVSKLSRSKSVDQRM